MSISQQQFPDDSRVIDISKCLEIVQLCTSQPRKFGHGRHGDGHGGHDGHGHDRVRRTIVLACLLAASVFASIISTHQAMRL